MSTKNDETRTSNGPEGSERGVGCAGVGLPDIFLHTDSPFEGDVRRFLGQEPVLHAADSSFGPPPEDDDEFA